MHMIKKGQLDRPNAQASTAASQFYSLAFLSSADHPDSLSLMPLLRQNQQECEDVPSD